MKRIAFLVFTNANGKVRLTPFVIVCSLRPISFGGQVALELVIDHAGGRKSWMNRELFFSWLHRASNFIARILQRKISLLLDNASYRGTALDVPELSYIHIYFLPKRTTPILQPIDLGLIASIKRKYRRRQCKHAVDLIEIGIERNLYKVDIKLAINWFYGIWDRIPKRIIRNCWAWPKLIY